MDVSVGIDGRLYRLSLDRPIDISIPLRFGGTDRLSVFGAPQAAMHPYASGDFIGDVGQGGSVNCEIYTVNPHCNGTHTECVGHITERRVSILDIMKDTLIAATVISVSPESTAQSGWVISRNALDKALENADVNFLQGLIVRTLPNEPDKKTRDYDRVQPAHFSVEAMESIVALGVHHLLVDLPSIDPLADGGALACHRLFWGVTPQSHDAEPSAVSSRTITELIYVPQDVSDGSYILNLQVAPFSADAAPSRPILYEVKL